MPRVSELADADKDKMKKRWEKKHPGIIELLGTQPDPHIGAKYSLTRARICEMRKKLGIPLFEKKVTLPDALLAELGQVSDRILSKKYGISPFFVRIGRKERNIPVASTSAYEKILKENLHLLGTVSDPTVGKQLGIPTAAVFHFRSKNKIKTKIMSSTHEDFVPLNLKKVEELFYDQKSDQEIADILQVSRTYILAVRRKLGLYRAPPSAKSRKPRVGKYPWDFWFNGDVHVLQSPADYQCGKSIMRFQIKNAAIVRNLNVKVSVSGTKITLQRL